MHRPNGLPSRFLWWLPIAGLAALADGVIRLAVSWAAAAQGAQFAGWVSGLAMLPAAGLLLLGGAWGDRLGQRRALIVTTSVAAAQYGFLAWAVHLGAPMRELLVINALLAGVIAGLRSPSATVYARHFVPSASAPRAVAISTTVVQVAGVCAPAAGGILIAAYGFGGVMVTGMAVSVLSVIVIAGLRPGYSPPARDPGVRRTGVLVDIKECLVEIARDTTLVPLLACLALVAGGLMPAVTLSIPLLVQFHGWGSSVFGLLEAVWVGTTVVVSVVVASAGPLRRPVWALSLGASIAGLGLLGTALAGSIDEAIVAMVLLGGGLALFTSHVAPSFIHLTPPQMLSRYGSVLQLVQVLPAIATAPALGALIAFVGFRWGVSLQAALAMVACVFAVRSRSLRGIHLPSRGDRGA